MERYGMGDGHMHECTRPRQPTRPILEAQWLVQTWAPSITRSLVLRPSGMPVEVGPYDVRTLLKTRTSCSTRDLL